MCAGLVRHTAAPVPRGLAAGLLERGFGEWRSAAGQRVSVHALSDAPIPPADFLGVTDSLAGANTVWLGLETDDTPLDVFLVKDRQDVALYTGRGVGARGSNGLENATGVSLQAMDTAWRQTLPAHPAVAAGIDLDRSIRPNGQGLRLTYPRGRRRGGRPPLPPRSQAPFLAVGATA
jgi:hypothetical protein